MKRIRTAVLAFAGTVAVALAIDYATVRHKERRLSTAVSTAGGRMGSLPAWPVGTESRIKFNRTLTDEDLLQLEIANEMRGWVGVAFQDCHLADADQTRIASALRDCHLYLFEGVAMAPFGTDVVTPRSGCGTVSRVCPALRQCNRDRTRR